MSEIMQPGPAPQGGGGGGSNIAPATPSNFAARVAQNSQQPPPQAPVTTFQPQLRQGFDRFAKPEVDGSQFTQQGNQQPSGEQVFDRPGQQGEEQPQGGDEQQQDGQQGQQEQHQALMAKVQEALQSGVMPEELMDMWTVRVPWGEQGNFRDVPVRDLQKSFFRQSDYTRAKTQINQHAQQLQAREQGLNNIFSRFDTPEGVTEQFMQLGKRKVFEQAAKNYLRNWWEQEKVIRSLPAEHQAAHRAKLDRAHDLEEQNAIEIRRREAAERSAQSNQTEQQQAQRAENIQRQMDQLRPMAFKAYGIQDTPYHKHCFEQELVAVVNTLPYRWNGEVSREMAWQAAQGAKERIEDDQSRALQANQQGQGQGQPMSPLRLPAGPNVSTPQSRQQGQRRRPGNFGDDMRSRNGGRASF